MIQANLAQNPSFHRQLHPHGVCSSVSGFMQFYFQMWSHGAPLRALTWSDRLSLPQKSDQKGMERIPAVCRKLTGVLARLDFPDKVP